MALRKTEVHGDYGCWSGGWTAQSAVPKPNVGDDLHTGRGREASCGRSETKGGEKSIPVQGGGEMGAVQDVEMGA